MNCCELQAQANNPTQAMAVGTTVDVLLCWFIREKKGSWVV